MSIWVIVVTRDFGHGDYSKMLLATRPTKELASQRAAELANATGKNYVEHSKIKVRDYEEGFLVVDTYDIVEVTDN